MASCHLYVAPQIVQYVEAETRIGAGRTSKEGNVDDTVQSFSDTKEMSSGNGPCHMGPGINNTVLQA